METIDDLLAGDHRRVHRRQRGFDPLGRHRQVAGDLVAHEQGDLAQQLAEQDGGRALVAHQGELVADQRMIDHLERRELLAIGGHRLSLMGRSLSISIRAQNTPTRHSAAMAWKAAAAKAA